MAVDLSDYERERRGGSIPIVITTTNTAGFATGDAAIIGDEFGAAYGTFTITVASR